PHNLGGSQHEISRALHPGDHRIAGLFVTVARVVKPQGRRGEVAVELLTDFPERFAQRRELSALAADGRRRTLQVEKLWKHKGRLIIKFAGIETIDAAEQLAGCEL